jgi:hypothetical protein
LMTLEYLQVKLSWVDNTSNKLLKIKRGEIFAPFFLPKS